MKAEAAGTTDSAVTKRRTCAKCSQSPKSCPNRRFFNCPLASCNLCWCDSCHSECPEHQTTGDPVSNTATPGTAPPKRSLASNGSHIKKKIKPEPKANQRSFPNVQEPGKPGLSVQSADGVATVSFQRPRLIDPSLHVYFFKLEILGAVRCLCAVTLI